MHQPQPDPTSSHRSPHDNRDEEGIKESSGTSKVFESSVDPRAEEYKLRMACLNAKPLYDAQGEQKFTEASERNISGEWLKTVSSYLCSSGQDGLSANESAVVKQITDLIAPSYAGR